MATTPNTLTALVPLTLARALRALRERATMPRLVNSDFAEEASRPGDIIPVPIPTAVGVGDVTPAEIPVAPGATVSSVININLDQWRRSLPFHMSDKNLMDIAARDNFIPMQVDEAMRAIANDINDKIFANFLKVAGYEGDPSAIPFSNATDRTAVKDATKANRVLDDNACPPDNRRGVISTDAKQEFLALPALADAEKIGSSDVKIRGEMGEKYGIFWFWDQAIPTHTSGTAGDAAVAGGTGTVGSKSITITQTTCVLLAGDVITFGTPATEVAASRTYVVQADATVGPILIEPGLKIAVADAVSVDVADGSNADYKVNLVFHRDAFALAMRPISEAVSALGVGSSQMVSMTDPVTGISLRLEVMRQYKQTVWEFDVLFGTEMVRQELATRLAGLV